MRSQWNQAKRIRVCDGHFEFKSWIQDKVEEAVSGEVTSKFLSNEDRNEEREEAWKHGQNYAEK